MRHINAIAGMCGVFLASAALSLNLANAQAQQINTRHAPAANPRQRAVPITNLRNSGIGEMVANVTFTDIAGRSGQLSEIAAHHRAIVLVVRDTTCPIAMKYGPRLASLEKEFAAQGVEFVFVNCSEHDSIDAMIAEAKNYGFHGAYVADREGLFAAALRPRTTTEVFVLDSARTLRYRGAVDDQHGVGVQSQAPRSKFLCSALDAVLHDQPVSVAYTSAPGCAIELPAPSTEMTTGAITWHGRISRIAQSKCQACHHDRGAAPFALETYESFKGRRAMIRQVVADRIMPPWHAAAVADDQPNPWLNDRSLSSDEREAILAWIDAGCAEGDAADAPLPLHWPTDWVIGTPDVTLQIPAPVSVPAEGQVDYQYSYVKTNFPEDRWITALEIRPTAPQVVHHVLVFLEEPPREGESPEEHRKREQVGFRGNYARMAPGATVTRYPPGFAKKLPAGAWLKFQIHYTPNGTAAVDQTQMGLILSTAPPKHEIQTGAVATSRFVIPAGASNHEVTASVKFGQPRTIIGFTPHMHLRGKTIRYELQLPTGERKIVCEIPRFDFNWQITYWLAQPIRAPRGSELIATAWYDNSAANPANPDPTRNVRFGPQVWDEMMLANFEWWR